MRANAARGLCIIAILLLGACARPEETARQAILITTTPDGAECTLHRDGLPIATVMRTPATANVRVGSRAPIIVVCTKPGFAPATYETKFLARPTMPTRGYTPYSAIGNLSVVLVATMIGAYDRYASRIDLTMQPIEVPAAK